jgi:outer membrane receptor for ferrienterochelin and colicin
MHLLVPLTVVFCFLLLPGLAYGQNGTISGVVEDQVSREPLPAANVQIIGTTLGAGSDVDGRFVIRNVPPGTYQIRGSLVGYQATILSDIIVEPGKPSQVVVALDQVPIGIGTVEVTASYFQKNPDAVVSAQRLSYEEIRRSPGGFEDVVRAISVLPGVAQAAPGRNDLIVRGGAPSENLFVVDNLEIPNINHFGTQGAAGGPLSYINLDFVRETAFTTGGFGVRYGDRLSSVLNIDLRDGRTDALGGKATISATQFGLNLEGPVSESGSFLFSARRSYLDFIFRASGFSFVPEYWDFLGKTTVKLDPANSLSFLGLGAVDGVNFFNDTPDNRYDNSRILGTSEYQYDFGATWRHLFARGFTTVTLGRTYVTYDGVQNDSLLRPIFTNRSKEGETGIRADVVVKLSASGATELSAGTSLKRARSDGSIALPNYVTSFGDTLNVNVSGYTTIGYKSGTYLQLSQHLPHGFQVTAGGRLDYFSLIEKQFAFSPRLSISWDVSPLTTISGTVGRYAQSPSFVWLVANELNRSMRQARVDQFVLGIEHLLRADFKVRLEGFYKKYGDYAASLDRSYLVLANTGAGYGGTEEGFASYGLDRLVSSGYGRALGVEFLAQKKLSEIPLYGLLSITWSRTRFTSLDGVERPGAFDQPFLANITAGYRFDDRWEASMKFRYAAGRPYTPINPDGTQNVSAYNSLRLKAYHALDLRVDRRWYFERWGLVAYLDIQNVYNNKYAGTPRWDERTRQVISDQNSIGILPSIGISAEF